MVKPEKENSENPVPLYIVCTVSNLRMKHSQLKHHQQTKHSETENKQIGVFKEKLNC